MEKKGNYNIVYWGYIGILEKRTESTTYPGYRGVCQESPEGYPPDDRPPANVLEVRVRGVASRVEGFWILMENFPRNTRFDLQLLVAE